MSSQKRTWVKSVFGQLGNQSMASSDSVHEKTEQKRPKLSKPTKTASAKLAPIHSTPSNWLEKFTPKSIDELAVHTKKIVEFQDWLQQLGKGIQAAVCLITGPTGSGKTATVRVVAKQYGYQLQEWVNPVDTDVINILGDQEQGDSFVGSQLAAFKSFIFRASRYKSVIEQSSKRLILVEDFPNVLISDNAAFENVLEDYKAFGKSPIVFIAADSESRTLNLNYRLFSDQIKTKYNINHISFNPISATLMNKAMKNFCSIMRQQEDDMYTVPTQDIIDSIVVSAQGDVRNALLNLNFSSLKGAAPVSIKSLEQGKPRRGKKKSELKTIGRYESITIFHALGRVLNPKFNTDMKFAHCPEEIADAFSDQAVKFVDLMFANYLSHFTDIQDVVNAVDTLGIAEILLHEYRENALATMGLSIGVRGVMCGNNKPIAGWKPVCAPKRLQNCMHTQNELNFQQLKQFIPANLFATDYSSYVKRILNKN